MRLPARPAVCDTRAAWAYAVSVLQSRRQDQPEIPRLPGPWRCSRAVTTGEANAWTAHQTHGDQLTDLPVGTPDCLAIGA